MGKRARNKADRERIRARLGKLSIKNLLGDIANKGIRAGTIAGRVRDNLQSILSREEFELVLRFSDEVESTISTFFDFNEILGGDTPPEVRIFVMQQIRDRLRETGDMLRRGWCENITT